MNRIFDHPEDQKLQWQNWSEKRSDRDGATISILFTHVLNTDPLIGPLSDLANELVRFDGYVEGKSLIKPSRLFIGADARHRRSVK